MDKKKIQNIIIGILIASGIYQVINMIFAIILLIFLQIFDSNTNLLSVIQTSDFTPFYFNFAQIIIYIIGIYSFLKFINSNGNYKNSIIITSIFYILIMIITNIHLLYVFTNLM